MEHVEGSAADHRVRCLRWREIDHHCERRPSGEAKEPLEIGDRVLNVDGLKKYYEVRDTSLALPLKRQTRSLCQGQ
jgi:peptide/nickel transport system ATP-binding protein